MPLADGLLGGDASGHVPTFCWRQQGELEKEVHELLWALIFSRPRRDAVRDVVYAFPPTLGIWTQCGDPADVGVSRR